MKWKTTEKKLDHYHRPNDDDDDDDDDLWLVINFIWVAKKIKFQHTHTHREINVSSIRTVSNRIEHFIWIDHLSSPMTTTTTKKYWLLMRNPMNVQMTCHISHVKPRRKKNNKHHHHHRVHSPHTQNINNVLFIHDQTTNEMLKKQKVPSSEFLAVCLFFFVSGPFNRFYSFTFHIWFIIIPKTHAHRKKFKKNGHQLVKYLSWNINQTLIINIDMVCVCV